MFAVSEESELAELKDERALYGLLLSYYGRVLRVRSTTISYDTNYSPLFGGSGDIEFYPIRKELDLVGRLLGLQLQGSAQGAMGESDPGDVTERYLKLTIEGSESSSFDFEHSTIEVLQADSLQWRLIYRGSQWLEEGEGAQR